MSKRAQTVETACPHCGHSPIPADADRCPGCNRAFRVAHAGLLRNNDREVEPTDGEHGTRIGGLDLLSSDAEAHPGTMAAALGALGLYAGAAGLGALPLAGEPSGYTVLGLANLALGAGLLAVPAFARPLVIVSAPLQVATWLFLGRAALGQFTTLAVALLPLLVLAGVTGATGPRRRSLALTAVLAVAAYSATLRLAAGRQPGPHATSAAAGLELQLPPGYELLQRPAQLADYLPLENLDPRLKSFGFADPVRRVGGFWALADASKVTPQRLAEALATELGGDQAPRAVPGELRALSALPQVHFEVPLGAGRALRVTGLRLAEDRTAVLVVAAPARALEPARQALAAGAHFSSEGAVHR